MRFLGCRFELDDTGHTLVPVIRERLDFPELDDRPVVLHVRISACGPVPADVATEAAVATPDSRGLVVLAGAESAWLATRHCAVRFAIAKTGQQPVTCDSRVISGSATIEVFGAADRDGLPVHVAIGEAVASTGLLPLHSAAMSREGWTVAVLGPSGAGKSTTAVLAALEGWQLIAEDSAWLDPTTLSVYGADPTLRLRSGTESVVAGRLADERALILADQPHDGLKRLLSYEALGGRRSTATLDELVLLARRDAEPQSEPLRPIEVAMALHQAAGIPAIVLLRRARAIMIGNLAKRLPGRRVSARSGTSGL